jgi:hypothetical protein
VSARAQCIPPSGSNEAKLLAFYEAPIAFTLDGAPERLTPGEVRLTGELSGIPQPSSSIERPEFCFSGKTENTRLAPVFPRPRVAVGLPGGFAIEASYLPPLTVFDAEPHLGSLAISNARLLSRADAKRELTLLVRAHATIGRVRGAITCPSSSLQSADPADACFGTRPSRDTFRPNMMGLEGALGTAARDGALAFYGGAGVTFMRPRFQVGFTDNTGYVDSTRVEVNLTRMSFFGGASYDLTRMAAISAQLYAIPGDIVTWRAAARYRIR